MDRFGLPSPQTPHPPEKMPNPPPCTRIGRHCRELNVTVRISDLEDDSRTLQDAAATWLTGHTERITWGHPYVDDQYLLVDATIHIPCRYLQTNGIGATCAAYGFRGRSPKSSQADPPELQLGSQRFSIIHQRKRTALRLEFEKPAKRSLPVIQEENPCLEAECRTADNTVGAACCRDLALELAIPKAQKRLEALLHTRRSPYLCKVKREDEDTMECEVISACGYLDAEDERSCTLHGRLRPNGRSAKPSLCSEWPDLDEDETGHPGCVFC